MIESARADEERRRIKKETMIGVELFFKVFMECPSFPLDRI